MSYVESYTQQACVAWFNAKYPSLSGMLFAVPNDGKRAMKMIRTCTGYKTICVGGSRKKAEGLVAGVSDLILLVPRGGFGALCIELKTPRAANLPPKRNGNEKRKWLVISISSAETLKPFQKR
mgnify:CR=1 FL=1